jgi:SNF2 family DNA or RNA helicase
MKTDTDKGKGPVNYLKTKSTLVVCPVSLIFQWQQEILTKTSPALKVVLYHGASRESVIEALADADGLYSSHQALPTACLLTWRYSHSYVVQSAGIRF